MHVGPLPPPSNLPPIQTDRLVNIGDLDEPITWKVPEGLEVVSLSSLPPPAPGCNCWLRKDIACSLALGCYTEVTLRERFHIEETERILIKISTECIPGHRPLHPNEEIYIHDGTVLSLLVERPRGWSETVVP